MGYQETHSSAAIYQQTRTRRFHQKCNDYGGLTQQEKVCVYMRVYWQWHLHADCSILASHPLHYLHKTLNSCMAISCLFIIKGRVHHTLNCCIYNSFCWLHQSGVHCIILQFCFYHKKYMSMWSELRWLSHFINYSGSDNPVFFLQWCHLQQKQQLHLSKLIIKAKLFNIKYCNQSTQNWQCITQLGFLSNDKNWHIVMRSQPKIKTSTQSVQYHLLTFCGTVKQTFWQYVAQTLGTMAWYLISSQRKILLLIKNKRWVNGITPSTCRNMSKMKC
jgi:hypothetical protein